MGKAVIPGNPYDSGVLVYLFAVFHMYTPQSTGDLLTRSSLGSFLSILAHFPKPKLSVGLNRM